jgi:hypothetical protein
MTSLHVAVMARCPAAATELLRGGAAADSLGPDVYPSYHRWKARRGLRAIQVRAEPRLPASPQRARLPWLLLPGCGAPSRARANCRRPSPQALMAADPGQGLDGLLQLWDEQEEALTAADMACCVTQHVPTVEALMAMGAYPSAAALDLAEQCTPIMR